MAEIEALADEPEVVAIGETGLDAHWPDNAPAEVQEEFLRRHIALSKRVGKPLVLHHRKAGERVAEILEEVGPPAAGGTFHCFAGDAALARRVIGMGFWIGIGGSATFKKSPLPELVREVGLEHVVLETDSPYLAPTPHRGKRNEPAYSRWSRSGGGLPGNRAGSAGEGDRCLGSRSLPALEARD
jgi:TatD DNase family protein